MLPMFRYHPDPVRTGSLVPSSKACSHCGRLTGYVYTGPIYSVSEPEPPCPACIADGSFADRFDASFTDDYPIAHLEPAIVDEVLHRTPGFNAWQSEQWLAHHDDAMAFLGPASFADLRAHPQALEAVRRQVAHWQAGDDDWVERYVRALSRDGSPTAYLFRCLHCGIELAYAADT